MPESRILRAADADIVAVSVGTDTRWSWRIVTRTGHMLQQSSATFPTLAEALIDGRAHLEDAARAQSATTGDGPDVSGDRPRPSQRPECRSSPSESATPGLGVPPSHGMAAYTSSKATIVNTSPVRIGVGRAPASA
jgi:hypothetical protein